MIGNLSRRGNSPCNSQHARNTHTSRKGLLLVTGPYRLSTDVQTTRTHPEGRTLDVPARTRWACKHAQSSVRALAAVRTTRRPGRPAGGARARAPVRWSLTPSVRYVYLARSLASFRAQASAFLELHTVHPCAACAWRAPDTRTSRRVYRAEAQRGGGSAKAPCHLLCAPTPQLRARGRRKGGGGEYSTLLSTCVGSGDVFDTVVWW